MIKIGKPFIYEDEDCAYLKAKISISDDTAKAYMALEQKLLKTHWRFYENYPPVEWQQDDSGLWFRVSKEYKKYLCEERADAFVIAMLYYAMMTGSDIECEAPVSQNILFYLKELLFPALLKKEKGYKTIKVIAHEAKTSIKNEGAVATGMSCGVDSLYSLQKYTADDVPKDYKLTHLTYFNMGAIFHPNTAVNAVYTMEDFYSTTDKMSEEKLANAKAVANIAGLKMVYVESNLDSDYYRGAYGYTGVYRNCAMVLALQKLFGKYYCSSAGWPEFFDLNLEEGSEHYETLLCNAFSTEVLEFIISDYATRFEKTKALADYDIAKKYLDVCFNFNNCGACAKCYRTLLTLDLLGKVDQFSKVFDVEYYKSHRVEAFEWLIRTKNGNALDDNVVFAKEIFEYAKTKNAIPKEAYKLYKKKNFDANLNGLKRKIKRVIKRVLRIGVK